MGYKLDDLPSPPKYNSFIICFLTVIGLLILTIFIKIYNSNNSKFVTRYNTTDIDLITFHLNKRSKSSVIKKLNIKVFPIKLLICSFFYNVNKTLTCIVATDYLCFKTKLNNYNYLNIHSPPLLIYKENLLK